MIIYFDTETTSLSPGRIIQLSYIIEDKNQVKAKNFFFMVDYIPIESSKIHGFTTESIKILSNGKTFSDYSLEIEEDFNKADLVIAHNISFDETFLKAELSYSNGVLDLKEKFDTMKFFTNILKIPRKNGSYKYPKLTELIEYFDLYTYDISKLLIKYFNIIDVTCHDARYDTTAMYLCVQEYAKGDKEFNNFLESYK